MKPSDLEKFLAFTIVNGLPVLVTGKPGIGKSDIISKAARLANARLLISHPVVSDPTDYKGLPFASNGEAMFLPFNDLKKLMNATELTVFFLDDLGQAPAAVQAACMQLILAREINGHKISDKVVFLAATNRKQDKAAVSGILEPVKSRFASIVELEVNTDDWVRWALSDGNMPTELVAFIRYRPELLDTFEPTKEIINGPSPRTISHVGKLQNAGVPTALMYEAFKGAAGEAFATEYKSFLDIYKDLPNIDQIMLAPDKVPVPTEPAVLYAVSGAIAARINDMNASNAFSYIKRLPAEISVACVKDTVTKKPAITSTRGYIEWATANGNFVMND